MTIKLDIGISYAILGFIFTAMKNWFVRNGLIGLKMQYYSPSS